MDSVNATACAASWAQELAVDWSAKGLIAISSAMASWLLGGLDELLGVLLLLLVVDFLLGLARGWHSCCLSARKLRWGLAKIIFYLFAVLLGHQLDKLVSLSAGFGLPLDVRALVIAYLGVNEALSICNHLTYFRVPLPNKLTARLRVYRDRLCDADKARGNDGKA